MLATVATMFVLFSLMILLGVSLFAVINYLQEDQMEKVPVRVRDSHYNHHR